MATTLTPQLQLNLPEVGASRDTWGALLNDNFTDLDEFVSMAMPIGAILDFAGPNAPAGWLICDGRAISRTTYSLLFAVISTYWGAGDGSTTFNLPHTTGRASIAPGTVIDANGGSYSFSFTETAGAVTQFIQQANLPNYSLATDQQGYHAHGGYTGNAGSHGHMMDQQGLHNHNVHDGNGGTDVGGDHTHVAWTDVQGAHVHTGSLPFGSGSGAASGSFSVVSSLFPATSYTTDTAGWHSHNVPMNNAGTHRHWIWDDGNHLHNISSVGDHGHTIFNDGLHFHNVALNGGGIPLSVLTPVLVVTKIIYAGLQASPYIAGTVVAPSALETADELAAIRQELAELRALFAPPRQRQIAAPMRGTH